ncbi:MAG TPA: hypothetical protein VH540_07760 [Ktedonobacterales bacterium]|jgi:hypothetical protein
MRYRGRGTEKGCAFLVGIAFILMGIWILFYGLDYIWYAVASLGIGLFFAGTTGMLLLSERRYGRSKGEE